MAKEKNPLADVHSKAKSVSEVLGEEREVSEVRHMTDLLDKEIIVSGFRTLKGDTGPYLFVYASEFNDKTEFGFCCGGAVVMEKLQLIKDAGGLPVRGTIFKAPDKKYYNFK